MLLAEFIAGSGQHYKQQRSDQNEYKVCCPFCVDRGLHEDTRYHLGINVATFQANCFRCGWKRTELRGIIKELCTAWDLEYNMHKLIRQELVEAATRPVQVLAKPKPIELPAGYEPFTKSPDDIERKAFAYLKTRGVTWAEILEHSIGYAAVGWMAWRIVFPVFGADGLIYGAVGRDFSGSGEPKVLNTSGLKLLWGGQHPAKYRVVTEGIFDALRAARALASLGVRCAALLGDAVTPEQIEQLRGDESVVYLPDWNRAGILGAVQFGTMCSDAGVKVRVAIPPVLDGRDPDRLPTNVLLRQYRDARPWSDATKWRLRAVKEPR